MERPFIHINCAATIDGKLSYPDGTRMKISCEDDMRRVHHLRSDLGSIMVGANTIAMDDPRLTVKKRFVTGFHPLKKIVMDGGGSISPGSRFLRTEGHSIIVTSSESDSLWRKDLIEHIDGEDLDAELMVLDSDDTHIDMEYVMHELKKAGVEKLLVEGGTSVLTQLMSRGMHDRLTIFYGPFIMGGSGPSIMGIRAPDDLPVELIIQRMEKLGNGLLVELTRS